VTSAPWRQFEIAVARFVAALDPNAVVRQDVRLPDVDTGRLRQRDVWIEAKICQHFPVKVLVSCKHTGAKLDEQDIDAFVGEFRSSGAHKGVLYSHSGYTEPAVEKAKKLGISCCRLYANQPADLPEALLLQAYCSTPRISLSLLEPPDPAWSIQTWSDLFALEMGTSDGRKSILDLLVERYYDEENTACKSISRENWLPLDWQVQIEVSADPQSMKPLRIVLAGTWRIYRGTLDAYLLDGSYSVTDHDFVGCQSTPVIDLEGTGPGPGWALLEERPSRSEAIFVHIIMRRGHLREALLRQLAPRAIVPGNS
jgi:hypothetical protein